MATGTVATSIGMGKRLVALSLIVALMVPPKPARAVLPVVGVLAQYIVPLMIASVMTAVIAQRDAANGRPMGKALDSAISGTLAKMGKVASAIEGTWINGIAELRAFSHGKTVVGEKNGKQVVLSEDGGAIRIAEPTSPPELYEVPVVPHRTNGPNSWFIDEYRSVLRHGGRIYQSRTCGTFYSEVDCGFLPAFTGLGMRTEGGSYFKDTGRSLFFFDKVEQIRAFEIDRLEIENAGRVSPLPIDLHFAYGPDNDRIIVSGALGPRGIDTAQWMILFDDKVQPSVAPDVRRESDFGKFAREATLTDESIANIVDTMWRASASHEDSSSNGSSIAYSATRPVTADEVQGWREANPSMVPTIYDIANVVRPNREPSVIVSPRADDYPRTIAGDITGTNDSANAGNQTGIGTGAEVGSIVGTSTGTSAGTVEGTKTDTRTGLGENVNVVNQPDVRVVNPVRIDTGPAPEVNKPGLEATPTAQSILSPILDMLPGVKSWQTPSHTGECARPSVDVFDTQIRMDAMCDIAEQNRSGIHSVMLAVFAIAALFIVLSA